MVGYQRETEEAVIGTSRGIVKCRVASRLAGDQCSNTGVILGMRGVPSELSLGKSSMQILTSIDENGDADEDAEEETTEPLPLDEEVAEKPTFKGGQDRLHVSREAIAKHGTKAGCPACIQICRRGHLQGRFGYNQNEACRARITTAVKQNPEYR